METAIDAVRSGFMGYFKASMTYGAAKTTLIRRYKGGNKHEDLQKLVYELWLRNNISNRFNTSKEQASHDLLRDFKRRYNFVTT